ncbi:MAG: Holliday junction resolvase RuvX [Actinomycetota bacterium]|nr:Holliday junction resolvase RuvX [Actinomycetota bacterium]
MARVLGIDPGTKRIGVALSDPDGLIASPHTVIEASDNDAREISRIANDNDVEEIVIGYPRRLDGSSGPAAQQAEVLADHVRAAVSIPVRLWDERLTSAQAEKDMVAHGVKRRRRRSEVDRVAAALILQSYLDARRSRS